MSNLVNYIKEKKNKTYKDMPFNEIDASIYACLSYINLSSIVDGKITIKDAYEKMQNRFLLKSKDKFKEENKELFKEMASSDRYKDNIITSYERLINNNTQFGALTIVVSHYFKFIAFEGTEDDLVGWEENFKMSYMYPIPAQSLALKYLKENITPLDFNVYVGGHSKGGNLALAACAGIKFLKRYQVLYVFNFDGPGFSDKLTNFEKLKKIEKKVINYYPCESVVGMILSSVGKSKIIQSKASHIYQHDIHSWYIEKTKFKEGSLSSHSKKIHDKTLKLMNKYSKDDFKKFVNTFFSMLYGANYLFKSDLKKISLEKMKKLLNETRNLNEEERKLLLDVFKTMVENTKDTTK